MYATLQDLIDALGEQTLLRIADRNGDGTIDGDVVAGALIDASGEIDSAVAKRYSLPMASVPARLKRICVDLAHYNMDVDPSEDVRKRVEDARKALVQIATGVMTLADAALISSGNSAKEGGASANEAKVGTFQSDLDMGGFS